MKPQTLKKTENPKKLKKPKKTKMVVVEEEWVKNLEKNTSLPVMAQNAIGIADHLVVFVQTKIFTMLSETPASYRISIINLQDGA